MEKTPPDLLRIYKTDDDTVKNECGHAKIETTCRIIKNSTTTHVNIAVRANFGDDHFTFGRTKISCHREEDEEYLQQHIPIHHIL
jgi:hypothetical protein